MKKSFAAMVKWEIIPHMTSDMAAQLLGKWSELNYVWLVFTKKYVLPEASSDIHSQALLKST